MSNKGGLFLELTREGLALVKQVYRLQIQKDCMSILV